MSKNRYSSGLLATSELLLQIGSGSRVDGALHAASWVFVKPSAALLATMSLNNDQASIKLTAIPNSAVKSLIRLASFVLYDMTSAAMVDC